MNCWFVIVVNSSLLFLVSGLVLVDVSAPRTQEPWSRELSEIPAFTSCATA